MAIKSEFDLIQTYLAPLTRSLPGTFGLADDAAVICAPIGHDLVVTTDAAAEGVHFFSNDSARDIAWKALAINVSDLIAKGATPLSYQMALSFPEAPSDMWMADFAAGLDAAQTAFGITLSGGDTDKRPGPLTITITAFGHLPSGRMVRRSTASAGDRLYVTGTLGDSALGLQLRLHPDLVPVFGLEDEQTKHLLQRYLKPLPPVNIHPFVLDYASAAMDISDGLAQDLGKLAAASGIGAQIETARIPLSRAAAFALAKRPHLISVILAGGDDYEVLAAIAPANAAAFEAAATKSSVAVTQVGELIPKSGVQFISGSGELISLDVSGWDHFRHAK